MSSVFKILGALFILLLLGAGIFLFISLNTQKHLAEELTREYGLKITIGQTRLSPLESTLYLSDVHIAQPVGYGAGDAMVIEKVAVTFANYRQSPLVIRAIEVNGVLGNAAVIGTADNFGVLQRIIGSQPTKSVQDKWNRPSIIEGIYVRRENLHTGNSLTALPDRNSQPINSAQQILPLKQVVGMALIKILESERQAMIPVAINNIKAQAVDVTKSATEAIQNVGDKVHDYLDQHLKPLIQQAVQPSAPVPLQDQGPKVSPPEGQSILGGNAPTQEGTQAKPAPY